jgi:hypothetical protein
MSEPENLVLKLLQEMRGDVSGIRETMATKDDVADVRSEVKSLRADVASDLLTIEKRLGDRISHLNRAVMEYHSSAVGHGLLFRTLMNGCAV